jgi:hypothetical protein
MLAFQLGISGGEQHVHLPKCPAIRALSPVHETTQSQADTKDHEEMISCVERLVFLS